MHRAALRAKFLPAAIALTVGLVLGGVLPHTPIHSTATHGTDTFAVCTGTMDGSIDAVFCLDYLTGDLTGYVPSRMPGSLTGAVYRYNVMNDFGVDPSKNPKFLMVTGNTEIPSTGGQVQPSKTVVYIAELTTGQIAGYAARWNRPAWNTNRPIAETFVPLGKAPLRVAGAGLPAPAAIGPVRGVGGP